MKAQKKLSAAHAGGGGGMATRAGSHVTSPHKTAAQQSPRAAPAGADGLGILKHGDDAGEGEGEGEGEGGQRGHNRQPDWGLWYIHGRAYDLAGFMHQHPGGADALVLARGRDCTALFESYHAFTEKPRQMLSKFLVPDAPIPAEVVGTAPEEGGDGFFVPAAPGDATTSARLVRDPFWEALRRECGAHLKEHHVETAMTWPFFLFGLALIALQVAIYVRGFLRGSYLAAVALGLVSWLVAGAFGHEGLHYGISRRFPWLNHVLGFYSISTIANPIIWKHQHTYSHHSFTNDHERDPDCHHFETMLRMHFANPHNALHRLLVHPLWVMLWWSQAVFGSAVLLPLKALATGAIQGATSLRGLSWLSRLGIVLHTVAFFFLLWVLPYHALRRAKMEALGLDAAPLFMGDVALQWLWLFTCFQRTIGILFGVMTQSTHLTVESMAAALRAHDGNNGSWARLQVETAANFAEHSLFWFIMSGGLNVQVEHHLFPALSHGALRKLTPVIRRVCREHNVHFKSYKTFGDLLKAVLEYFAQLADPENKPKEK